MRFLRVDIHQESAAVRRDRVLCRFQLLFQATYVCGKQGNFEAWLWSSACSKSNGHLHEPFIWSDEVYSPAIALPPYLCAAIY